MSTPLATLLQQAIDLHRLGRTEEAVRAYKKILRKDRSAVGALNLLGLAEFQLGHLPEAADALGRAARLNPELPNVDYHLAHVFQAQGRHQDALVHLQKAVARAPQDAEVLNDLGKTLAALGQHDEAIANYQRATRINPRLVHAWHNLGNALSATQRFEESRASYAQALALQPDFAASTGPLAYVLYRLGRLREAIDYGKSAATAEPHVAKHHINLATALAGAGQDEEALAAYDRALEVDPESGEALWNKGQFMLSRGHFAEGWPLFEQRWRNAPRKVERRYAAPRWGGERVTGTLLAWAEQGLGDQILYASMIPDLCRYADHVVVEVEPRLVGLLARSFPDVTVAPHTDVLFTGPVAAQTPLEYIGRYLRPNAASFPSEPYLVVDHARASALRTSLRKDGRRIIGLSWGSTNAEMGRSKSARLAELLPVLRIPNCSFVDLQYGDTRTDRQRVETESGIHIHHVDDIDNTNDIDGLTALMAACDAVVSVSNTNAHLAAAQGKATFVLLSEAGLFWYWMKRGDATPFYPSAKLFRKTSEMTWTDVAAKAVVPALKDHLDRLPDIGASALSH